MVGYNMAIEKAARYQAFVSIEFCGMGIAAKWAVANVLADIYDKDADDTYEAIEQTAKVCEENVEDWYVEYVKSHC